MFESLFKKNETSVLYLASQAKKQAKLERRMLEAQREEAAERRRVDDDEEYANVRLPPFRARAQGRWLFSSACGLAVCRVR